MSQVPTRPDVSGPPLQRRWPLIITACLVNSVFALLWLIGGFMRGMRACEYLVGNDRVLCESHNGGPPKATVFFWWFVADAILLLLWVWIRRRARSE